MQSQKGLQITWHDLYIPGVTILLSLTVFLDTVSSTMPVTSDSPILGNQVQDKYEVYVTPYLHKSSSNCNHLDCFGWCIELTFAFEIDFFRVTWNDLYIPGVTILLSLTIFLQTVTDTMPVTSDSPILGN